MQLESRMKTRDLTRLPILKPRNTLRKFAMRQSAKLNGDVLRKPDTTSLPFSH